MSSVNNNSNYAWQYKSGNNWVCINEGTNVINGNTYYVTGARYNMTTNPGPIVFTNPNSALNGLQIRCLISDGQGVNPCNMPSGNTWTSNSPFTIDLNNTPCNLTFGFTSPNCTGDKFTWSQTINPLNGNPSIVKLVSGNTNTYTINGGFPSQMTSGPVNLIISQVVSYDGYSTRKSVTQPNERWRMIFQKNGVTIYTSPYTDDVEDFKQQASWTGSLGSKFFAPDGIDKIILEHYDVANGYAGPGSVVPAAICINYETCPSADAGPNKDLNCTTTSTKVGTTAIAGNTYSWSPATGLSSTSIAKPTASPVNTTVYTVTVTSQSGCTATSSVTVSVDRTPPVISIDGVKEVCKNSLTTLTAISNIQNVSYLWNNGANSNKITVGEGTYTVKVTYGVCESTDTAVVEKVQGTIGNFVWNDIDLNGLQNEPQNYGINNISVELWNAGPDLISGTQDDVLEATTTTANDVNNNPGYYNFTVCNSGYYFVKFPANIERMVPTKSNQIAGIDGNSDINKAGYSPVFYIDVHGNGITKDNNTIDAGYFELKYIGDYVWNDLNRNGIQDPNEVGVAGVVVSLLDENNKPIASTITDAYGYYRFDKIYSGNYKVSFTLPSGFVFSPQNAGVDTLTDSDVDPLTGTTNLFSYQAGTIDISRDAGIYLTQVVNATLGDRVWLDMNENGIQDPEEKGMVGITVTLYDENNKIVSFKITDDNGLYSFKDLQPGNYRVGFSLPIGYVFSKPYQGDNEEYDSNPNNSTHLTDIISLSAGETNNTIDAGIYYPRQDLHLPGSIGNFVWNDFNQDGVQQNFEKGIQGVKVILYDETGINALDSTVTDVFGYYIFNNLFEGNYIVQFTDIPEGYVMTTPKQGIDSTLDSDPNPINGKTNIIVLNEGEINTTIDAGLYNPNLSNGAIGDYVWYDRNKNGIQDKGENGVAGVAVSLYDYNDVLIEKTITNNYGYYLFNNVPEGTYYINFSNLPHGYKLTTPNQGGDINLDSNPSVKNGNTEIFTLAQNEINITFDAGIVKDDAMDTKSSLGDKVWNDINHNGIQDIDELGVQGVTVTLYESNGNNVITSTITNALGSYIFTDLDEGDYVVGFSNLPVGYTFTLKNQGGNKDTDSDVDAASNGKTSVINLRKGENNLTIDAGIYLNANLASLGDFVWNDINQNGIQDAGEPGIQGVSVSLLDESGIT
ncbi:MAG: hypothetical protein LC096_01655, partial [Bacteroidia bacterium]|nr:hypothetical protein [Bacteroidia bacterium]